MMFFVMAAIFLTSNSSSKDVAAFGFAALLLGVTISIGEQSLVYFR